MKDLFVILILGVTCSCSTTGKFVQSSDRFDHVVLGRLDRSQGFNIIGEENRFTFIVDTILKGSIQTVDGFEMKKVNYINDSMATIDRVPVKVINFKSIFSFSEINFEQANSILISSEDPTDKSLAMQQQICMFGDNELKDADNLADSDPKARISIGSLAKIELDQKQFQKTLKGIRRKARK